MMMPTAAGVAPIRASHPPVKAAHYKDRAMGRQSRRVLAIAVERASFGCFAGTVRIY
jgi:hypothetical protein